MRSVSDGFANERKDRMRRRELRKADFDQLAGAGFLLTGVPARMGGLWDSVGQSTRTVCEALRVLAHGDPSVALVASMHPAVILTLGWLPELDAPDQYQAQWKAQREWAFNTALAGHWWGTITSEPGSGGDIAKSKAVVRNNPKTGADGLTGAKHFGSGSGVTSFMVTAAIPEGEDRADFFYLDMRGAPWDGTTGVKLVAPWDGYGMTATQSHGMQFDGFPATRVAWPNGDAARLDARGGCVPCMFAAVVVGVLDVSVETARAQLIPKKDSMRAYEKTEWATVQSEYWQVRQLYEGMLRAQETAPAPQDRYEALLGKTAIAGLTETALGRITRVLGGGTFSRSSPFIQWQLDSRALGYLRPPWGLAYDQIFEMCWSIGKEQM